MAGVYPLEIEQGATFERPITWYDGDPDVPPYGTPIDVTDYLARAQIRTTKDADDVLVDLTDWLTVGTEDGVVTLSIPAEDTALMDWNGSAYWDLELESPGGQVTRLLEGRATLSKEVTREDSS